MSIPPQPRGPNAQARREPEKGYFLEVQQRAIRLAFDDDEQLQTGPLTFADVVCVEVRVRFDHRTLTHIVRGGSQNHAPRPRLRLSSYHEAPAHTKA